nr:uncharacterized protein LOC104090746 [Nicotiana tomentosiformis]
MRASHRRSEAASAAFGQILQSCFYGHKLASASISSQVRASADYIHTVIYGVKHFIGQFQLDELPCEHALASLRHRNESYENYYSSYYTRESLMHTYEIPVDPLPDKSKWNVPQHIAEEVVKPPTGKRQPVRPQK